MVGIIDVGGGMRGAYGTGVFDYCLENGISFDFFAGVSAGAANIASFLANQKERNLKFYTEYAFRKEYMSFSNLLKTGNFLDLDYIYGEALTNSGGEYPIDYDTMVANEKPAIIVATDAVTGKSIYYNYSEMRRDDYGAIKGSSCVPVVNKPYLWKGKLLLDGGMSDPLPFHKAFEAGCDKVVIILTRPKDFRRSDKNDRRFSILLKRKYPKAAKKLATRAYTYNRELDEAVSLESKGKVLIVAPKDISGMKTLTKDKHAIKRLYKMGKKDASAILNFMDK